MPPTPDAEIARCEEFQDMLFTPRASRSEVETGSKSNISSCWTFSIISLISVVGLCTAMLILRGYIRSLLLWIELQEAWISFSIFLVLFLFVSFPFTWGYVLLNITAGYLYGLIFGLMVTAASAAYGIFVAHLFLRKFCSHFVKTRLDPTSANMNAILQVLRGQQSFKLVALTRLTPIPFGLQNAFFSVTDITLSYYMSASVCGLLPTQFLNTYIGSTLRSMEDVLSDESAANTGYIVFTSQLVLTIVLMVMVIRKARSELKLAVQEAEVTPTNNKPHEHTYYTTVQEL